MRRLRSWRVLVLAGLLLVGPSAAAARSCRKVCQPAIRNWATSGSRVLQRVALAITRVDGCTFERRHDEVSLRALVRGLDPAAV